MAGKFKTLTPAQAAEVETLAAVLTAQQVADYFGIGRTTFFRLMERDPEIEKRYKRGKARAVGAIAQSLIQKARGGDTACMIFYLKTQAGWRETARLEHSGPEGEPVQVKRATELLREHLDRLAPTPTESEAQAATPAISDQSAAAR